MDWAPAGLGFDGSGGEIFLPAVGQSGGGDLPGVLFDRSTFMNRG
jgi:hypothetical protein